MRARSGKTSHQKHKAIRQATKGMGHSRRRSYRLGKQAVIKSLQYAYRDRRNRKRVRRGQWISHISAASKESGISYSSLMKGLKQADITLDRRVLAQLAIEEPKAFDQLLKFAAKK